MEKYDYRRAMINDIKEYIKNNPQDWADPMEVDDFAEYWHDELWAEDCITGNGPYGYDTEEKCEEYLATNIDLGFEACEEFCVKIENLFEQAKQHTAARYIDSIIRCYLLYECIYSALEELNNE